jgi:hypothetical protein
MMEECTLLSCANIQEGRIRMAEESKWNREVP